MLSPPLDVVALGPVSTDVVMWRASGVLRATVVIKATFSLLPGREASVAPPLPIERVDGAHDDSPSRSLRSASETAPYLPSAGVLLTGHACAPAGPAVNAVSARLALSGAAPLLDKTVHVFGDQPASGGAAATFQTMPLVYERAYGGPGVPANPVGVGGQGSRRPNLVDPSNAHRPAGFGPIAAHWPLRRRLFGGIEPHAAGGQVLDLPGDFDFRAFHAAPADQQIPFLQGDEWILLDNLSPGRARVQTRLPSARGQARWYVVSGAGVSRPRELRMFADMLVIDADRQVVSLVWRGHFPIELPEILPKIRIFAGMELPSMPIEWPEREALGGFAAAPSGLASLQRTAPAHDFAAAGPALPFKEGTAAAASFQAPGRDDDGSDPDDPRGSTGAIIRSKLAKPALPFPQKPEEPASQRAADVTLPALVRDDDTADPLAFTGKLDVSRLVKPALPFRANEAGAVVPRAAADDEATGLFQPGPPRPQVAAPSGQSARWSAGQEATAIAVDPAALGFRPEPLRPELSAVETALPIVLVAPMAALPFTAAPPFEPPPLIETSRPIEAPPLVEASRPIGAPPLIETPWSIELPSLIELQRPMDTPPLDGGVLLPIAPPAEFPPPAIAHLPAAAPPGPVQGPDPELRKRAQAAIAAGRDLHGEDYSGADLSGLDFSERSLQRCSLRGTNLRGARLKNANLAEADLADADLTAADLTGATLASTQGDRAILTDALLIEADLTGASFAEAVAERVKLTRARGEGAVFRGANLRRADFTQARFPKASFTGADLREAQAEQGNFVAARFVRADLTATSFRKASLVSAVLAFARLDGTDLRSADLDRANFHGAPRRKAKLVGAVLTNLDETEPKDLEG